MIQCYTKLHNIYVWLYTLVGIEPCDIERLLHKCTDRDRACYTATMLHQCIIAEIELDKLLHCYNAALMYNSRDIACYTVTLLH